MSSRDCGDARRTGQPQHHGRADARQRGPCHAEEPSRSGLTLSHSILAAALAPIGREDTRNMNPGAGAGPRRRADSTSLSSRLSPTRIGLRWISRVFSTLWDLRRLREFLDQRVRDGVLRRVVDRWRKAGVLEEGKLVRPRRGEGDALTSPGSVSRDRRAGRGASASGSAASNPPPPTAHRTP